MSASPRLQALLATLALLTCALQALAQTPPPPCCPGPECPSGKIVRIIVPFAPGSTPDSVARLLARGLEQDTRGTYVVENRVGAGGIVAAAAAAKMEWRDGFLIANAQLAAASAIGQKMPFSFENDLQPLTQIAVGPLVLAASAKSDIANVREFVTRAKQKQFSVATAGTGSVAHLALEQLQQATGTRVQHVPYKGVPAVYSGIVAREVDAAVIPLAGAQARAKAGEIKILAVWSQSRVPSAPDVPTVAESLGPNLVLNDWIGAFAARADPECTNSLGRRLRRITQSIEFRSALERNGLLPPVVDERTFAAFVKSEISAWSNIAKTAGIKRE